MLLLGLDTSTPAVTVALHDGASVLAESTTTDARRHGELLAPAIDAVLRDAGRTPTELTGVAVGVGPGPYTGLRVGVVTAASLADALEIAAHGICSLDVVAATSRAAGVTGPLTAVTDARRREVFWAAYDDVGERVDGPRVDRPRDAAAHAVGTAVGPGAVLYADAFDKPVVDAGLTAGALCTIAASRLLLGEGELLPVRPIYLRRPDAQEPHPPKRVLA
jgi:tRNA threonylcarbamoyl adenosine modification protein YeaZ